MLYRLALVAPTGESGSEELRVLEWHFRPGEPCARGGLLVEVETGKAVLEVRSAIAVSLRSVLVQDGEWFKPGATIAVLSDAPDEPLAQDPGELLVLPMGVQEL
jgi:pyruvate/2-oxoglutarate dehydrogenase complex dihydrolipoamide acyltransferase (E2) component